MTLQAKKGSQQRTPVAGLTTGSEQSSGRLFALDSLSYLTSVPHGPTVTGVFRPLNSSESES